MMIDPNSPKMQAKNSMLEIIFQLTKASIITKQGLDIDVIANIGPPGPLTIAFCIQLRPTPPTRPPTVPQYIDLI